MKRTERHLLSTVLATFVILCFLVIAINYTITTYKMKELLRKRATYTLQLTYSLSKLYSDMDNIWQTERISMTKMQTFMIASLIDEAYKTGGKPLAIRTATTIIHFLYTISPNTYSYVIDLNTGNKVAHPFEKNIRPPKDILQKIRSACPESLISYQWYKPDEKQKVEKYVYVKCIPSLGWAVGTSLYLDDIKASLSHVKSYIEGVLDTLTVPLDNTIEFRTYIKLPNNLKNIPTDGSVKRKDDMYVAIIHSNITDMYYVYSIDTPTITLSTLMTALPYILIILLFIFFIYFDFKRAMEKNAILDEIYSSFSEIENTTMEKEELLELIKKRIQEIEKALSIKEFTTELSNIIASSNTLHEAVEYLYNYLQPYLHINGIFLSVKRGNKETPLVSLGKRQGISLTIPHMAQGKEFHLTLYTEKPLSSSEVEIFDEILRSFFAKVTDISEAITDPLTGAYTRKFLDDYGEEYITESEMISLLMLDLDHFKEVNDTLGHDKGDEVLKEVVKRIEKSIRNEDVVIRLGGDEFVVLMRNIRYPAAQAAATRIRENIKHPPIVATIPLSASIGCVWKNKNIQISLKDLLKMADTYLYKAKEKRDEVVCGKAEVK